jgi:hypothetical protein
MLCLAKQKTKEIRRRWRASKTFQIRLQSLAAYLTTTLFRCEVGHLSKRPSAFPNL